MGAAVHLERDDSDILGRKKASYLDYVELWKSVVDPTRLKVTRRTNLLFMCWLAGWLAGGLALVGGVGNVFMMVLD